MKLKLSPLIRFLFQDQRCVARQASIAFCHCGPLSRSVFPIASTFSFAAVFTALYSLTPPSPKRHSPPGLLWIRVGMRANTAAPHSTVPATVSLPWTPLIRAPLPLSESPRERNPSPASVVYCASHPDAPVGDRRANHGPGLATLCERLAEFQQFILHGIEFGCHSNWRYSV